MTRAAHVPQAVGDALDTERWLDEGGSFSRPVGQPTISGTLIALPERLAPAATPGSRPAYACPDCGHLLRASGLGRHRVYFELGDERSENPVMNRVCPACGYGLSGKNPR
jgi:ssDNA-binding Zn-finger/Zn-ribbon topoisomerase 1